MAVLAQSPAYLTAELVACIAWRFWLGALSNKGGRVQRSRSFSHALRANFAARGFAARAPGSTKPPCYAGYRAGGRGLDSPGRTNTSLKNSGEMRVLPLPCKRLDLFARAFLRLGWLCKMAVQSPKGDGYKIASSIQGHPTTIFGKYLFERRFEI